MKYDQPLKIRVSAKQKEAWTKKALDKGLNLSELIRERMDQDEVEVSMPGIVNAYVRAPYVGATNASNVRFYDAGLKQLANPPKLESHAVKDDTVYDMKTGEVVQNMTLDFSTKRKDPCECGKPSYVYCKKCKG